MKYVAHSKEETQDLAYKLAKVLFPDSLVALNGDLASGKTTFTQGLAKGLNIKKTVNSPTFNILKIYEGDLTLYHIDAYRLYENPYDLGFEDYLDNGGVMVIEWFDYIKEMFKDDYLEIRFTYLDENSRLIEFIPHGQRYEELLKELDGLC